MRDAFPEEIGSLPGFDADSAKKFLEDLWGDSKEEKEEAPEGDEKSEAKAETQPAKAEAKEAKAEPKEAKAAAKSKKIEVSAEIAALPDLSDEQKQSLYTAGFTELALDLSAEEAVREIEDAEQVVMRNAYFSIGECYIQLAEWDEAIKAYQTAANRYQDRPEVLEAYFQLATAYLALGQPANAQISIRQLRHILQKMDDKAFEDAIIKGTGRSKRDWQERLNNLIDVR